MTAPMIVDTETDLGKHSGGLFESMGVQRNVPNEYDPDPSTTEQPTPEAVEEVLQSQADNGPNTPLRFDDGDFPTVPQPAEGSPAPVEAPLEEGSLEWANQLINTASGYVPPSNVGLVETPDPESVRLARAEGQLQEIRRQEELAILMENQDALAGSVDPVEPEIDPLDEEFVDVDDPDEIAKLAKFHGVDEDVAKMLAKQTNLTADYIRDNIMAPRFEELEQRLDQREEEEQQNQHSQAVTGNLLAGEALIRKGGNAVEIQLLEQFNHSRENSLLWHFLDERDDRFNWSFLATPEGVQDAVRVVAGRVLAGGNVASTPLLVAPENGNAIRTPGGSEEGFASIGSAVLRGPNSPSNQPNLTEEEELADSIVAAGKTHPLFT